MRFTKGIVLVALVALAGCGSKKTSSSSHALCAPNELTNRVAASDWATARSGVAEYVYTADLSGGIADVDLLDDKGKSLGALQVRQIFSEDDAVNGAMEAVLNPNSDAPLRLLTHGRDVDETGYTVAMRLEPAAGAAVDLTARFDATTCWSAPSDAPACAGELSLTDRVYTLPSCGLVLDDFVRQGRAPTLTRLTYAIATQDVATEPTVGTANSDRFQFDVMHHRLADRDAVEQWLTESGADHIIGSDAERLLTTAYLDRSWRRALEEHVTHCELDRLHNPPPTDRAQTLCPTQEHKTSWASLPARIWAKIWGDPHLVTLDGHAYDLQSAGEFVAIEATSGDPFQVQARFEPLTSAHPECGKVSMTTAVATMLGGRRVTVTEGVLRVDGEVVDDVRTVDLPDGASIVRNGSGYELTWPGGERVNVFGNTIEFALPETRAGQVRGLLGQFDGVLGNEFALRDGHQLDMPASFDLLHGRFADSWRVTPDESLFDYDAGAGPGSFDIAGYPGTPARIGALPSDEVAAATTLCEQQGLLDPFLLDACILDVVCLGEEAADTMTAPPIFSMQPLGLDLFIYGDVRPTFVAPEPISAEPLDVCIAAVRPTIALFEEQTTVLSADLTVDIVPLDGATKLAAGTDVQVLHLSQRELHDRSLNGLLRFNAPILGVIVDDDKLAATDDLLGVDATYPTDLGGLRDDDVVVISEDGRSLHIQWKGDTHHRLRVLVSNPRIQE